MAATTIDLTTGMKDCLTALPPELQHIIIGYLFPTHTPNKAFQGPPDPGDRVKAASHSLDYLAATCRSLRAQVFDWARVFLTQHNSITKYKPVPTVELHSECNYLRGIRGSLLEWAEKHCIFCGKKSTRSAILMNGFRCCHACDLKQWPEKITKTEAKRAYDLKDHHLLPHEHHATKLLTRHPGGLPKLRYGTYMTSNIPTTMFLRKDVVEIAELVHGDLKAHLEKRAADREERVKKAKKTKVKKEADLAFELQDPQVQVQLTAVLNTVYQFNTHLPTVTPPEFDDEFGEDMVRMTREWSEEVGATFTEEDEMFSELYAPAADPYALGVGAFEQAIGGEWDFEGTVW